MKSALKSGLQPPQLPKPLPAGSLPTLDDHAETSAVSLSGCDFTAQSAEDLLFEQVSFQRAVFQQTRLARLRWFDVRASGSDFSAAAWDGARLRRAEFSGCRLLGIQLLEAHLEQVLFKDCNLEGAVFASAVFKFARFEACNLRGAIFEQADLSGVVFRRCDLTQADLSGAKLPGTDLRGSQLNGLRVAPADIRGAIIEASQAVQVAALLGVVIEELELPPF
jgi:uncharacterized protein YjbI with pentapeptide repeats